MKLSLNHENLTRSRLVKCLELSDINYAIQYTDPDSIAEIIQCELNTIIETISPTRYKQFLKKYAPYYNNYILNEICQNNQQLTLAIQSNNLVH